jgi:hypothetical protein
MADKIRAPWWKRPVNLSPAAMIFLGLAFGAGIGGLAAYPSFDGIAQGLWLWCVFMGGSWGCVWWLLNDTAKRDRFILLVNIFAPLSGVALFLAFPDPVRQICSIGHGVFRICLLGGLYSAWMMVVGVCWGFGYFAGYLFHRIRGHHKALPLSASESVWDPEFDHDWKSGDPSW